MVKIEKDWCGLVERNKNGKVEKYEIYGDLIVDDNVTVDLDRPLFIFGNINISGNFIFPNTPVVCIGKIDTKGSLQGYSIETYDYINCDSVGCEKSIKAGTYLYAKGYVLSGRVILSGTYIKSGDYIKAGEGITAFRWIDAKSYISANGPIYAGVSPYRRTVISKNITCSELRQGEIKHGKLIIKKNGE